MSTHPFPSKSPGICGGTLNAADTLLAASMTTLQVPVPVQAPLQPLNVDPLSGAAVSVTTVPAVKLAEHVDPQLTPAGLLLTLPLPVPDLVIDKARLGGRAIPLMLTDRYPPTF